jgi:hypothetical protein
LKHIEDSEQALFFQILALKYPGVEKLTFAIPNGGKRNIIEAFRLKKCGVKSGVPDIFVSIKRKDFGGLYIEMKKPITKGESKPSVSPAQKVWISNLNEQGYLAVVAYGCDEAIKTVEDYIN